MTRDDMRIIIEALGIREIADALRFLTWREWAYYIVTFLAVGSAILILAILGGS